MQKRSTVLAHGRVAVFTFCMKISAGLCVWVLLFSSFATAAPKRHVVTFGKWTTVKWMTGIDENVPVDLRIRPLFVDGRTKEFTTGTAHDVTDRVFVVQRVYRLNDLLPKRRDRAAGVGSVVSGYWWIVSAAGCNRSPCPHSTPTTRR